MGQNKIESPCTNICQIHPETRLCIGCARSIEEIMDWARMSAKERNGIMAELPKRQCHPET
ncbi:DUF1289 domain-containing protein [Celeribacter halophilus]|uniref:DUF1289 domain-containing protein n=1 Tax=Celeribacter halophilus TaxID=576117 RepID=UPI003A8DD07E